MRTLSGIPDGGSIVILGSLSATNPDKEEEKAEVEGRKWKISSQLLKKVAELQAFDAKEVSSKLTAYYQKKEQDVCFSIITRVFVFSRKGCDDISSS